MNTNIFMLYAKALLPKVGPKKQLDSQSLALPSMPLVNSSVKVKISPKHCMAYSALTCWQPSLAAVIHPCYIQTLSLSQQLGMMVSKDFPFSPMGTVHIANQIKVGYLPNQSDELQLNTSFGNVYMHKRGWLFEVITTAFIHGVTEPAVTATSFYLSRYKHERSAPQESLKAAPDWITRAFHNNGSIERKEEGGTIQDSSASLLSQHPMTFNADIGRKYASISGDYNPIHLHAASAKLFGFKKAIAHGMYSKALVLSNIATDVEFYHRPFSVETVFTNALALPCTALLSTSNTLNKHLEFRLTPPQNNQTQKPARRFLSGELHF